MYFSPGFQVHHSRGGVIKVTLISSSWGLERVATFFGFDGLWYFEYGGQAF